MALKNVSDKYAGQPFAPIKIPPGASFADMVALKGKSDIGDQINKKILGPLARENNLSDMPDFDDPGKLGSGKDKERRLRQLVRQIRQQGRFSPSAPRPRPSASPSPYPARTGPAPGPPSG